MLTIKLTDVYGDLIEEPAEIRLTQGSKAYRMEVIDGHIDIAGLKGIYALQTKAKSYHSVGQFIDVPENQHTVLLPLPIKASKVRTVSFPDYADLLPAYQYLIDPSIYASLDSIEKAGLLNILTKCRATNSILSHITDIDEIHGDRIYCRVTKDMLSAIIDSELFLGAPGLLHEPPPGTKRIASCKTKDTYGNLQVTVFEGPDGFLADIDIDDANGLRHIYQVVRNSVAGPTNPYNIHQILTGYQHLDTNYRLHI